MAKTRGKIPRLDYNSINGIVVINITKTVAAFIGSQGYRKYLVVSWN